MSVFLIRSSTDVLALLSHSYKKAQYCQRGDGAQRGGSTSIWKKNHRHKQENTERMLRYINRESSNDCTKDRHRLPLFHVSHASAGLLLSGLSSRELKNLSLDSAKALVDIGTHHISFINKSTQRLKFTDKALHLLFFLGDFPLLAFLAATAFLGLTWAGLWRRIHGTRFQYAKFFQPCPFVLHKTTDGGFEIFFNVCLFILHVERNMGFDVPGIDASDLADFWICVGNGTESFVEEEIPGREVVEVSLDGIHPGYSGLVVRAFPQLYVNIRVSVVEKGYAHEDQTSSSLMKSGILTPTRGCLR